MKIVSRKEGLYQSNNVGGLSIPLHNSTVPGSNFNRERKKGQEFRWHKIVTKYKQHIDDLFLTISLVL